MSVTFELDCRVKKMSVEILHPKTDRHTRTGAQVGCGRIASLIFRLKDRPSE